MPAPRPLLIMTRVVDGSRAAVFEQWLRPERMARWWSDADGSLQVEARPDGDFRVRRCGGRWTRVAVRDHARPERLVFTWGGDQAGTDSVITVSFAEHGTQTRVTLSQCLAPRTAPRCGPWSVGSLDRLAELLARMPSVAA